MRPVVVTRERSAARPLGKVWIVGAGPGDPELVTVRAARLIAEADDLVVDALVPPEIYRGARGRVIYVGKRAGRPRPSQRRIEDILVRLAREPRRIVRLKGGDPSLFARLAEEVRALEAAGVPYEIVPGISSLTAVPLAAGIPLTDRDLADRVVVLTGHRSAETARAGAEPALDLPPWDPRATYVCFMALGRLADLAAAAVASGFPPDLPAVVVSKASLPDERWIAAPLYALAEAAARAAIEAPATVVIGGVVERLVQQVTASAVERPAS
jgi:uroporphyrin-III C-methyltransferase